MLNKIKFRYDMIYLHLPDVYITTAIRTLAVVLIINLYTL